MNRGFNRSVIAGIFWSVSGRLGYLSISLIANSILARLMSPVEYGQVGIIMFFVAFARVLTESGLAGALIRKVDATEEDFSTVFLFNLLVSLLMSMVFFFMSSPVAEYYRTPELKSLLIIASVIPIIDAFQITYNARLVRNMQFRRRSSYDLIAVGVSSVLCVCGAYFGAGVYAILGVQVLYSLTTLILMTMNEPRIERFKFSIDSFLGLYKFGVNTTVASLINTGFDNVYQLILGKNFSVTVTGFFYQARKLDQIPAGLVKTTTNGVLFASLSKLQNNIPQFVIYYQRMMRYYTSIIGVLSGLVYLHAEFIIDVVYGEQWLQAAYFLRILSVATFFQMQEVFNRLIFKVFDQTFQVLILEVAKKSFQLLTIALALFYGDIQLLMYGVVATNAVSFFVNFYFARSVIGVVGFNELLVIFKVVTAAVVSMSLGHLFSSGPGLLAVAVSVVFCILFYIFSLVGLGVLHPVSDILLIRGFLKSRK